MITSRQRILLSLLILGGKSTYQKVFGFFPPDFKATNYYGILRRMEKDGLLKRGAPALRLLPGGLSLLETKYGPRIRRLGTKGLIPPGKGWTFSEGLSLVIYDFPGKLSYQRCRLQQRLTELGCGCLRRGVYLSFDDVLGSVAEWSEENRILEYLVLQRTVVGSDEGQSRAEVRQLISRAWDFGGLQKDYLSVLDRLAIAKGVQLPDKQAASLRRIRSDFLALLIQDPLLPKSLLPADWPLDRVRERIVNLY